MSGFSFGPPPLPPPPKPPMMTTRRLSVLLVVLVIVGVVGIVLALHAGGGSSKADSTPPPTSTSPSVDRGPGTGLCALPDGAVRDNGLQMSIALQGVLDGTLTAPIARWRYAAADGAPHSVYCFENVTQSDFSTAIGYLGLRGWVKQGIQGKTEKWHIKSNPAEGDATDPPNVLLTVSGDLAFERFSQAPNVGSVQIEWF